MIDAVLGLHINPATCGVAKFNARLARELGVPHDDIENAPRYRYPLVSVKPEEMAGGVPTPVGNYDLFLHGVPMIGRYMGRPTHVYAANQIIARSVRHHWPNVIEAWCPSTIEGNPHRGTINVLTFGMAHKIQTQHYEKLKALLDATSEDYTVSVSTAIHEGSPWDETALVAERLRAVFSDHLRSLGYLADDALARELRDCTAVALFFDPALRANNTTAWAGLEHGKCVITNLDADSPHVVGLVHIDNLRDFDQALWYLPTTSSRPPSWAGLIEKLQAAPCAK